MLRFALDIVAQLRAEGMKEAADQFEEAARYPATTGNEWVGVMGLAAKGLLKRADLSPGVRGGLKTIRKLARRS